MLQGWRYKAGEMTSNEKLENLEKIRGLLADDGFRFSKSFEQREEWVRGTHYIYVYYTDNLLTYRSTVESISEALETMRTVSKGV